MYLHERIQTADGVFHSMAGVIKGDCTYTGKSVRFGYCTVTENSGAFFENGGCADTKVSACAVKAHEFHYFESTSCGEAFTAQKIDGRTWKCCHVSDSLYAGFPHINFLSDISLAERFVMKCVIHGEINV